MRIALDAKPLLDAQKTGIGYFENGIVMALMKYNDENQFLLQYFSIGLKQKSERNLEPFIKAGAFAVPCRAMTEKAYKLISTFIPLPYSFFFKRTVDITHFFNFCIPPGVRGKKIVVIHDMSINAFPETMRLRTKAMLRLNLRRSIRRADHIVTISEFSKKEIIRVTGIPAERISVIPCGVNDGVFHPNYSKEVVEAVKRKFSIDKDYFLYLGTLEPRKNIERLIEAYAALLNRIPNAPLLVLAGRKGWMYAPIFEKVKLLNLSGQVIFTDYVQDAEVPLLISGALAFLYPSLYEGFGMPVLEAMACGTPVLTSNAASLPEVAAQASILVDPLCTDEITKGMEELIKNEHMRRNLSEKGLQRAREFTWERSGRLMMELYKTLMKNT